MIPHPKGSQAKILLTSVFGPYAQDDDYGSRALNPMELYHNQVTRMQGAFSLRMFHRSWGIQMIQHNINAPCTVLDFPSRERFRRELERGSYDVVGISSIVMNLGKVRAMCRMVREHSPQSAIVIGGHVTALPGLEEQIDADHIVRGEGIAWMRRYLGEDLGAPIAHPAIVSGFGLRVLGITLPDSRSRTAATVIPSVGCPLGCNFCSTSAFFGGKGRSIEFYRTGDELYEVMAGIEATLGCDSFFMMDENFLLHRKRALRLLELMEANDKSWSLYVFSSANALRLYSLDELIRLGVSWVWMGLESEDSGYQKLAQADTLALVGELRANGIKVLGSTIIGMEHHTPETVGAEVEHAITHGTDFHQFMLYTPVPGTPLYEQIRAEGRLLDVDPADIHGQFKFNFKHQFISRDESQVFLEQAFLRDLERNGPSLLRICETLLKGWLRHKDHSQGRVRKRWRSEVSALRTVYAAALWAMERHVESSSPEIAMRVRTLRREIEAEFGLTTRTIAAAAGPLLLWSARREERRLAGGLTYEPPTFLDRRNWGTT